MVRGITFHVEGEERQKYRGPALNLREGFQDFFREIVDAASKRGLSIRFRLRGSRKEAFDTFCASLTTETDYYHVLLVDSEGPVTRGGQCWRHLRERKEDSWKRPRGVDEEQCQLMVQAIEAWLFADPDALAGFYQQDFNRGALIKRVNVEKIPKGNHIPSLEEATRQTTKGRYHKTKHLCPLLRSLSPEKVRERSQHCNRIFTTLMRKIDTLN